ncbi:MAG: hypothetical protein U9R38_04470 [Candidatus Margulisiibacteriota bacterium]|nr:hypothetical protein [Candidatus Margulisiibacteriota bacterium]
MVVDYLKKGVLVGLGVSSMIKERAEKEFEKMQKDGESDIEEGKKLVTEWIESAEKQNEEFQKRAEAEVQKVLESFPLATKKDIDSIKDELKGSQGKRSKKDA